jgi:transposase-like protein
MPRRLAAAPYVLRRRWTVTDARSALAALAASGLSPRAFARREGLEVQRLYRWRRQLSGEPGGPAVCVPASPVPELIEIRARRAEPVEIVLKSGIVLRVSETIEACALVRLVSALEQSEC